MKQLLVVKCGAPGDVLRTTPLLRAFAEWDIDWLTFPECKELLPRHHIRSIFTRPAELNECTVYDLVVSLEDDEEYLRTLFAEGRVKYAMLYGACYSEGVISYTPSSSGWFDLGLISRYGLTIADRKKFENRLSYQELLFDGLGLTFHEEQYILPAEIPQSELKGDIAVAPNAGSRWPSKNWASYDQLVRVLSKAYSVNVLPRRGTMLEHMADIRQHRLLISGDSLPMHIALGLGIPAITLFTCTSPWEIYGYGLQTKVISPVLEKYFYSREYHKKAVESISVEDVLSKCNLRMTLSLFHGSAS